MKRLTFLLALFTLIMVSCGSEPGLEGKWQIESVSGEELTEHEKSLTVDFQEGGTMVSERDGEKDEGSWELSDDRKTLSFTRGSREVENEVVELTEDKLVLKEDNDKITFKRL